MRARRFIAGLAVSLVMIAGLFPAAAFADDALGDVDSPRAVKTTSTAEASADASSSEGASASQANEADADTDGIEVSREGSAALKDGASFAISDFSRAQKGSNRTIADAYYGYSYLVGQEQGEFVQVIAADDYVVAYVPQKEAAKLGLDVKNADDQAAIKAYFIALDDGQAMGSAKLSKYTTWYFATETTFEKDGVCFNFDQAIDGNVYASTIGVDGSDLTDSENSLYMKPAFCDYGKLASPDAVSIVVAPTGLAAAGEFLANLDWSPLWVSLRTTGIAIVFIVILGLLAAYFCLNLSSRAKSFFDAVFTIPMVLPPTVCGFVLLYACGSNTAFGQFWINIGFPLIFSPVACIIAAVVVAFPLMYRNALGAFESLDRNMLDAARTLGWSNLKIFRKLMLPLSWSSIAAGIVLAFARALGEFGATLFMAGNYVGITRTIPIAIYFEWMNGNDSTAWFWTAVIIVFSLIVIVFINLWSSHTTKYRKREQK